MSSSVADEKRDGCVAGKKCIDLSGGKQPLRSEELLNWIGRPMYVM